MPRGPMSEEEKEHLRQVHRDRKAKAALLAASDEPTEPAPPPEESPPAEPYPPSDMPPVPATPENPLGQNVDWIRDQEARRAKWTAGLPADVALLITDAEIAEMEAAESKRAVDERKKQALEAIRAQMRHEARVENDLIAASTLRTDAEKARLLQKGRIRINVPLNGSGNPAKGSAGFRVDGRVYSNGNEYVVTRAEYESLLPNHFGQWLSELRFSTLNQSDGESARAILGRQIPEFEFRPL